MLLLPLPADAKLNGAKDGEADDGLSQQLENTVAAAAATRTRTSSRIDDASTTGSTTATASDDATASEDAARHSEGESEPRGDSFSGIRPTSYCLL